MLLHRMALVSSRLFCKNLGNLEEFFGQMVYRPPWPKIARTPMITKNKGLRLELNKGILDIACGNFQQEHDMDRLQCVNKIDLRGLTYRRRTFLLQGANIFHEL